VAAVAVTIWERVVLVVMAAMAAAVGAEAALLIMGITLALAELVVLAKSLSTRFKE
jgi:hypothetical protein